MQVDFAFHAIARTIFGEPGHIDLADAPDPELEGIALPHAVDMLPLKSFAARLWLCLDANEKSMLFKDTMNRSPGTGEVELVLNPSGSPRGIFFFEPDNSLFQRY
jgi:hypothetical protein